MWGQCPAHFKQHLWLTILKLIAVARTCRPPKPRPRTLRIDGHCCATYVWTRTARREWAAWGKWSRNPRRLSSSPTSFYFCLESTSCCCCDVAFFFDSWREITHSAKRKNSTGSRRMLRILLRRQVSGVKERTRKSGTQWKKPTSEKPWGNSPPVKHKRVNSPRPVCSLFPC